MSQTLIPTRFAQQPQQLPPLDSGNQLTAAMTVAVLPAIARGYDAATRRFLAATGMKVQPTPGGLAGGFGSLGAGTSDKILTGLSGAFPAAGRSYYFRARRNGGGGGGLGRLFDKTNGSTGQMLYWSAASNALIVSFYAGGSEMTNAVPGSAAAAAIGVDFDILLTHLQVGSTASIKAYVNGVLMLNMDVTGTPNDAASTALCIGNRNSDNARGWDGLIETTYVWDRILAPSEAIALSGGRYQVYKAPSRAIWNVGATPTAAVADLNWTEAGDTAALTAVETDSAALAWTEGGDIGAAAAVVTDRAAVQWTEAGDAASLTATAETQQTGGGATISWTEAGDIASIAATLRDRAAIAATEGSDTWALHVATDFVLSPRFADFTIMRFSRLQQTISLGPARLQQTTGFP